MILKPIPPFLLLVVLVAGCRTDNTFTHRQFQERIVHIHTIGLVPQIHTAMLDSYRGFDPSPAPLPEDQQIRSELIAATKAQLEHGGFVVVECSWPEATNQIWTGRMIQGLTPFAHAGAPEFTALATNWNVDGLVFLTATAYQSTPHRKKITLPENTLATLEVMTMIAGTAVGGGPVSGKTIFGVVWQDAALNINLVEGKTGEVLWTAGSDFDNFSKTKPVKSIEDLFGRYPKSKP